MPRATKTAPKKPAGASTGRARQAATPFDEPNLDEINWDEEVDVSDIGEEDEVVETKKSGLRQKTLKQIHGARALLSSSGPDTLSKPSASTVARKKYLLAQSKALREHTDQIVQDTNAYIDQMLTDADGMLAAMRREASAGDAVLGTKRSWKHVQAALAAVEDAKAPLADELSPMRQQDIEAASAHYEAIEHERDLHLKRVLRNAKHQINGVIEEEQVAADATAWIRDFKRLLRC
ncbi:hypothetical protein DENSPDRAFT_928127 [Dentipellis sp. KUC8613]|nr:hypothetical protein DENSPDRAFT_928127 [Dentipellis sp. KUC8613]